MHREHTRSVDVPVSIHTHTRGKLHYRRGKQLIGYMHVVDSAAAVVYTIIISRRCPYPPLRPAPQPCHSAVIVFPTPTRSADRHTIPYHTAASSLRVAVVPAGMEWRRLRCTSVCTAAALVYSSSTATSRRPKRFGRQRVSFCRCRRRRRRRPTDRPRRRASLSRRDRGNTKKKKYNIVV